MLLSKVLVKRFPRYWHGNKPCNVELFGWIVASFNEEEALKEKPENENIQSITSVCHQKYIFTSTLC